MLPEGAKPILSTGDEPAPLSGGAKRARGGNGGGTGRAWGRWVAAAFAFSAVVGFGSLIAYTYLETRDGTADPNSLPVVRADTRPMKIRPDQPGGIDVPFQDKEIYNRVGQQSSGGATTQTATGGQAERLLPGPEAVMPRPTPTPPPAPRVVVPDAPQVEPTADAVPVMAPPRASIPPGGANAPASAPSPAPAPTPTVPAARPAPQAPAPQAAAAAAAGGIRIQLASVRSQADAQREWERLRRQHADVLGNLTASFPTVDLGDRGMFWRIQAGGFANADAAQAACAALRARGAGCNVVR